MYIHIFILKGATTLFYLRIIQMRIFIEQLKTAFPVCKIAQCTIMALSYIFSFLEWIWYRTQNSKYRIVCALFDQFWAANCSLLTNWGKL